MIGIRETFTRFSSYTAFPGCLPEGDGAPSLFESAADAWRDHLNGLGDDAWSPDDEENDPHGPQSMTPLALELERMEENNREGSVYGDALGYHVEAVEMTQAELDELENS